MVKYYGKHRNRREEGHPNRCSSLVPLNILRTILITKNKLEEEKIIENVFISFVPEKKKNLKSDGCTDSENCTSGGLDLEITMICVPYSVP